VYASINEAGYAVSSDTVFLVETAKPKFRRRSDQEAEEDSVTQDFNIRQIREHRRIEHPVSVADHMAPSVQ